MTIQELEAYLASLVLSGEWEVKQIILEDL
jgi:hypothetical protein